jgi:hypothetical protein
MKAEVRTLTADVRDLRERVARLEAGRHADRSQIEAEVARFKAEVERAEFRITRLPGSRPSTDALPEPPPSE